MLKASSSRFRPSSTSTTKRIATSQLKPGMFLVCVDQSWWNSPFFRHNRLLKTQKEVDLLLKSDVKEVMIDLSRGLDVTEAEEEGHVSREQPFQETGSDDTILDEVTGVGGLDVSEGEGEEEAHVSREQPFQETGSDDTILDEVTGIGGLDVSEGEGEEEAHVSGERSFQQKGPHDALINQVTVVEGEKASTLPISPDLSPQEAAENIRNDAIEAMESIFEGVKTGEVIDQPKLQPIVQSLLQQVLSQGEAMVEAILIQNLRQFDKALYGHVVDVAVLSTMVGVQLGYDEESLQFLALGGLLHDVGQVRVPRNLLRRRHNLIGEEQVIFERHVELGLAILECCPTIPREVHRVVAEHHERQDGSGYPRHLGADDLSVLSDVVGFIDQFDALVSQWGPPPCLPTAFAIRKLYQEAKLGKLRSVPVEALIRCLGVYPIGSFVSLSTGERAIVLKTNANERLKPTVKIISDSLGKTYDTPVVEDLSIPNSLNGERVIQTILDPAKYKINVGKYF